MSATATLFTGLCVCTTGLALHVNEQIRKIVQACGGAFDDDLTRERTTHLVADAVGSHKYHAAVAQGLPIVASRWVFDSFRAHALLDAASYVLRALDGLVICTTGLSEQTCVQIERLAALHGGVYEPGLEVGRTNVLIAQAPSGAKYEAAMAHGIPVVHVSWLHACVEKGVLVDETAFSLETMLKPRQLAKQLRQELDELAGTKMQQLLVRYWQQQHQQATHAPESLEEEEYMELFDACGFYLVGFPTEMERTVQRLLRTGMGTIYYEMQLPAVSHVVVSPVVSDLAELERLEQLVVARNAEATVHFVSAKWIVDSIKCLRLEPEEMYPVEIEESVEEMPAPPTMAPSFDRRTSFASSVEGGAVGDGLADASMELPDDEDVYRDHSVVEPSHRKSKSLKDYGFLLVCVNPHEPKLVRATVKDLQQRGGAQAVALDHRDFELVEPAQFDFVTHIVVCSGVSLDPELADVVRLKFAAFHRSQQPDSAKSKRIRYVSELWVRCCLASDCVVSHEAHELFTVTYQQPRSMFPHVLPLACFKRIIACTSVYIGMDRQVILELLQMAGARVSAKLSKKNTHLICLNPIGMKYEKAREWGLTIVTARWVVQSVLHGELLDANLPEFQVVDEDVTVGGDLSSSTSGSRTTLGSMDPARAGNGEPDGNLSQEWTSRRASTS